MENLFPITSPKILQVSFRAGERPLRGLWILVQYKCEIRSTYSYAAVNGDVHHLTFSKPAVSDVKICIA